MDTTAPQRKRFTSAKPHIVFDIDDDEFEAIAELSAEGFVEFAATLADLGEMAEAAKAAAEAAERDGTTAKADKDGLRKQVNLILTAVEMCLTTESAELVAERLKARSDKPISLTALTDVLSWLLEDVYGIAKGDDDEGEEGSSAGERPTQPTSDSSTGPSTTGVGSAGD